MKSFLFFVSLWISSVAMSARHHAATSDRPSVHGMVIMGQTKIYLSHLPMFHSPHDYQVLLEVELDPSALASYKKGTQGLSNELFTIVPEVFVLPEMIENPKTFSAQIYKGHFERGGQVLVENAIVQIKKVLHFKKFDAQEVKPAAASYVLIGNETEQFLVHTITTKPDFDQILNVKAIPEVAAELKSSGFINIVFANHSNAKELPSKGVINGESGSGLTLGIEVLGSPYLEYGDLAM